MRTLLVAAIYISAYMLLTACSPESATLYVEKPLEEPPVVIPQYDPIAEQTFTWISEDGGQRQLDFNPQVDILFITDDSDSMRSAQENLSKNMDRFTSGLLKNKMIDYHIGVVSVWDSSERYLKAKKDPFELGDLRFIKNSQGKSANNRRYITKSDGSSFIAPTLKIGVTPYEQGGPEYEEMFSPLAAALQKTGRGASNEGFFRKDAQLVVIFVTDADDSTANITPEQMARTLIDFKGGKAEKVSVYGVLVKANDPDSVKDWDLRVHPKYHPECFDMTVKTPKNLGICKGFGPERLEQLIVEANKNSGTPDDVRAKHIMAITSPKFGDDLGKIGSDITAKTLAKEIFLSQRPRLEKNGQFMLKVRYGNQAIPQQAKGGWLYNPENNSIYLSGDIAYQYVEGARFTVEMVPLTLKK